MSNGNKIIHFQLGASPTFIFETALKGYVQQTNIVFQESLSIENLVNYLKSISKSDNKLTLKEIFGTRPFEIVFQDRIMELYEEIPETTPKDPIRFYLQFLREPGQPSTEDFFIQRGWYLDKMKSNTGDFDRVLEKLQDTTYKYDHKKLVEFLGMGCSSNESSKGIMISYILMIAFLEEGFKIKNEFPINVPLIHKVQADHAILDEKLFPLLITEDKSLDMHAALIQNLDQLRSFSMTAESESCKIVYGLISNQKEWIFTCYIRPKERITVKQENFVISKIFELPISIEKIAKLIPGANGVTECVEINTETIEKSKAETLIRTLRGFVLRGNKGRMIEELFLKSPVRKENSVEKSDNGLEISFFKDDLSILFKDARARIIERINKGDILLDVFAGSGALSVLAAKKGLTVYANETLPDCHDIFISNINKHEIENIVFYNANPGEFLKDMILKYKIQHICMLEPNNCMRYLDVLVQAFQHRTNIQYSSKELPFVYICGTCKEDPHSNRMQIMRQVERALMEEEAIDFKADIISVEKLQSHYIYCLQLRFSENLIYPAKKKELEPYFKKPHTK